MNTFFSTAEGRRLYQVGLGLLSALSIFVIFEIISVARSWQVPETPVNTISVAGSGMATSTPNVAEFSFSVATDAAQAADAQQAVNGKAAKVIADLKALGIEDKDIQTSDYSVYPKYVYTSAPCSTVACPPGNQKQDGYTANESVTVKVRDMAKAPEALTIPGQDGATNLSGLTLTLDDPNAPADLARTRAIADAKAHAEALAKELGVSLVRVVGYEDNSANGPIPLYATGGAAMAKSEAPLATGQNTVSASVTVTYEIR